MFHGPLDRLDYVRRSIDLVDGRLVGLSDRRLHGLPGRFPICQSIRASVGGMVGRSVGRSVVWWVDRLHGRMDGWLIPWMVARSVEWCDGRLR